MKFSLLIFVTLYFKFQYGSAGAGYQNNPNSVQLTSLQVFWDSTGNWCRSIFYQQYPPQSFGASLKTWCNNIYQLRKRPMVYVQSIVNWCSFLRNQLYQPQTFCQMVLSWNNSLIVNLPTNDTASGGASMAHKEIWPPLKKPGG